MPLSFSHFKKMEGLIIFFVVQEFAARNSGDSFLNYGGKWASLLTATPTTSDTMKVEKKDLAIIHFGD